MSWSGVRVCPERHSPLDPSEFLASWSGVRICPERHSPLDPSEFLVSWSGVRICPERHSPLDPSMSFLRAGAEYGSARSISEAWSRRMDASSTRFRAGGMSCFRISSSLLLIVSYPTWWQRSILVTRKFNNSLDK